MPLYNTKLALLKESRAVKLYAHDILQNNLQYYQGVATESYTRYMLYIKYALYAGADIAIALIAFIIIRTFIDIHQLIEGAKLARETAALMA